MLDTTINTSSFLQAMQPLLNHSSIKEGKLIAGYVFHLAFCLFLFWLPNYFAAQVVDFVLWFALSVLPTKLYSYGTIIKVQYITAQLASISSGGILWCPLSRFCSELQQLDRTRSLPHSPVKHQWNATDPPFGHLQQSCAGHISSDRFLSQISNSRPNPKLAIWPLLLLSLSIGLIYQLRKHRFRLSQNLKSAPTLSFREMPESHVCMIKRKIQALLPNGVYPPVSKRT